MHRRYDAHLNLSKKERTVPDYDTGQLCTSLTTSTHLVVGPSLLPNPPPRDRRNNVQCVVGTELGKASRVIACGTLHKHVRQHVVRAMKYGGGPTQPTYHHRPSGRTRTIRCGPLFPVQRQSMELPATTDGCGGDATPCKVTREEHGLSF